MAPATFNTVNKLAAGASDTLALGLLNEGLGAGLPVVAVPWSNRRLAGHPAYARSIAFLHAAGVRLVLTERNRPQPSSVVRGADDDSEPFPWQEVRSTLADARRGETPALPEQDGR